MRNSGRAALGTLAGAAIAALVAPLIRPLFSAPTGGVGFVTVTAYPKSWDYAVIALLITFSFIGGALGSGTLSGAAAPPPPRGGEGAAAPQSTSPRSSAS